MSTAQKRHLEAIRQAVEQNAFGDGLAHAGPISAFLGRLPHDGCMRRLAKDGHIELLTYGLARIPAKGDIVGQYHYAPTH